MRIPYETHSDIRMGVWSHFYDRFWSGWFLLLVILAAMGITAHIVAAIQHQGTAQHDALMAFIEACVVASLSFHKHRIMRLLQGRQLDKRLLGEMASVVCSLAIIAIIGTTMA